MLPDRSVLIGQKLVENANIKKFKCDILSDFQTMCSSKIDICGENMMVFLDKKKKEKSFETKDSSHTFRTI